MSSSAFLDGIAFVFLFVRRFWSSFFLITLSSQETKEQKKLHQIDEV